MIKGWLGILMNINKYKAAFKILKLPVLPLGLRYCYVKVLYDSTYTQYCKDLDVYKQAMSTLKESFKVELFRALQISCNTKKDMFFNKLIWIYDPVSEDDFLKMYNLSIELVELIKD